MKSNKKQEKYTTISCDESTHGFIAEEAKRINCNQREVLAKMVKVYQQDQRRSAKKKKEEAQELRTANEIIAAIDDKLKKLTERDETVIKFIKQHEKQYSNPALDKMKNCETLLNDLILILQNLE